MKLSLYLIKHQIMNTYGGVEVNLHSFLTSACTVVRSQLHTPATFLRKKNLRCKLNRGLCSPKAGRDVMEKRKSLPLAGNEIPVAQFVATYRRAPTYTHSLLDFSWHRLLQAMSYVTVFTTLTRSTRKTHLLESDSKAPKKDIKVHI
jgi:hypothetical protein